MGFQCGIVGLPNVGKSTIFNALTSAGAEAANFPFCTKDPNVGVVAVPDTRLGKLSEAFKTKKEVPSFMQFVDIAGLVRGAHKGEGLGNQFLQHIRDTDAIMHVVRCFDDIDVTHVENTVDPVRDAQLILTELILKDLDTLQGRMNKDSKLAAAGQKDAKQRMDVWTKLSETFDNDQPAFSREWSNEENSVLKELHFLTAKPMFFCANVLEGEQNTGNAHVDKLKKFANELKCEVVIISGKIESEIAELKDDEKIEFLKELGMDESGLDKVIHTGYRMLGLQHYFTAGEKECRAWTVRIGAKAPEAAGVIHSDFERGFIRAETLSYADFLAMGSWNSAREKGLIRTEGKEYEVKDGDIMHFLFNV